MSAPGFWDSRPKAEGVLRELKRLKGVVAPWEKVSQEYEDLNELSQLIQESDKKDVKEIATNLEKLKDDLEQLEFRLILAKDEDKNDAILNIHPGAGGTEACDWAEMLLRMYLRWAEKRKFKTKVIDLLPGGEAGIKDVTVEIEGSYAYGYLKAERGVHRLVRISPFDANKRRHTSFASVDVMPEVGEEKDSELKPEDLKIDVFRSSGPGGQSVNTTDSAVRVTHLPTGIVVSCQNERSQYKNKVWALKVLKARLYQRQLEEERKKLREKYGEKLDIAWGSQIRSYVFHPYSMVKDHRTNIEEHNVSAVMDGEIDRFIEGFLKKFPDYA